jgi:hypothetical protein
MDKYIKPRDGEIKVRTPRPPYPFVPENGMWINWNGNDGRYWRRRVRSGDVILSEPPIQKAAEPKVKQGKKK